MLFVLQLTSVACSCCFAQCLGLPGPVWPIVWAAVMVADIRVVVCFTVDAPLDKLLLWAGRWFGRATTVFSVVVWASYYCG